MGTLKTITGTHPDLVATIHIDEEPESPAEWETIYRIAYLSKSRNVLGTEATSVEMMDEIGRKVRDGEYIGIPVWAYVHGGATIQAAFENPFDCPWDSGRSGWVYCTREDALADSRRMRTSPQFLAKVHQDLMNFTKDFDTYLQGDVYWVRVHNKRSDEETAQLSGIFGWDNAVKMAEEMLAEAAKGQPLQGELVLEGGA